MNVASMNHMATYGLRRRVHPAARFARTPP